MRFSPSYLPSLEQSSPCSLVQGGSFGTENHNVSPFYEFDKCSGIRIGLSYCYIKKNLNFRLLNNSCAPHSPDTVAELKKLLFTLLRVQIPEREYSFSESVRK